MYTLTERAAGLAYAKELPLHPHYSINKRGLQACVRIRGGLLRFTCAALASGLGFGPEDYYRMAG